MSTSMDYQQADAMPPILEPAISLDSQQTREFPPVEEPKHENPTMIKCDFSGYGLADNVSQTLEIPDDLISDPDVFHEVLSKATWDEQLNDGQKTRLMKLLPANVASSNEAVGSFLTEFFDPKTPLFFNDPLNDFRQKLAGGFYDAACANEVRQLKACARLHYEHRIREYYGRMLKKVLIYRRKLLEAAAAVPEGDPFTYDWKTDFIDSLHRERNHGYATGDGAPSPAWRRALKRSRMMIMDCKARAGEPTTLSSDDEDFASPSSSTPTGKGGANGHGHAGTSLHGSGHHGRHAGHLTFDIGHSSNSPVRSTLARPSRVDLDLHEPFGTSEIKDMVKEYRRLRRTHPEHPSLEFDDIELDDVVDRCGTEIRLMAQKWGVYTRQPPAIAEAAEHSTTTGFPAAAHASRKTPAAKHAKHSAAAKEKDK